MSEGQPAVSIIMPVYNTSEYLHEAIDSVLAQTLADYELICIDDGSDDGSSAILAEYAQADARIRVVTHENRGLSAARNEGLSLARGMWVIFLDSDDTFSDHLLELAVSAATQDDDLADMIVFDYKSVDDSGCAKTKPGANVSRLPRKDMKVFSWRDCPDDIMGINDSSPWNKLYRRAFLVDNGLLFDEVPAGEDIPFAAVCSCAASRIVYLKKALVNYRVRREGSITAQSTSKEKGERAIASIERGIDRVQALPHADQLSTSISRFAIEKTIECLRQLGQYGSPETSVLHRWAHETFSQPPYVTLGYQDLSYDPYLFQEFDLVRSRTFDELAALVGQKLIVSVTSYPARIGFLREALDSILDQTRPADDVVVWLSRDQFPQEEAELPEDLRELIEQGVVQLEWCDGDLKPHKKYFYAMQAYPDVAIVTIDDDLHYKRDLLERLWLSYLRYPEAVSATRTHLMIFDEQGELLSYDIWLKQYLQDPFTVSMQYLATGGAGALYPPGVMPAETFDEAALRVCCPQADDIWLKTMEVLADVPVAIATVNPFLSYIQNSQKVGLLYFNLDEGGNDAQIARADAHLRSLCGETLAQRILGSEKGKKFERSIRSYLELATNKLERLNHEKWWANARLRTANREKATLNNEIEELRREVEDLRHQVGELTEENDQLTKSLLNRVRQAAFTRMRNLAHRGD